MAKATVGGVVLRLNESEARFLVDLLFHHVSFETWEEAEDIYVALGAAGYFESDEAPYEAYMLGEDD